MPTETPATEGAEEVGSQESSPRIRPQTYILLFCAEYVGDPCMAVFSGSYITTLGKVGVGEYAARSTISRMLRRGTLEKVRRGKRIYLRPSKHTRDTLEEGGHRAWRSAVNRDWDGRWTLLGFSFPEQRRADRHLLRSRLVWAGFGMLQNGLWIAPRVVDVREVLDGVPGNDGLKVFHATVADPTEVSTLVRDAWDLTALRGAYEGFLARWDVADPLPQAEDDLARQLALLAEWLMLVRHDPGLPVQLLPGDWPAVRAEHVALRLRESLARGARRAAESVIESIQVPPRET
ncbi:phenylacetic acid degradation operon negative regulatory protein [Saccharomonospora amisosensis]|uniref:Phenylacetic acid degradation operon negative regulatory protein n=1 Tax=Saccharomonospora amisosensis TaxID=1128677 RepID=A0A7X5UQW5_9PSEU|nr:PaaX family transcriptional regulator C-terminal domain-containing protein [Saccharomonospora amisosensis]NIJ12511.1 phenylacetic acid degradation operon negative regulatory protein [Saccharomonospora amisosensis]